MTTPTISSYQNSRPLPGHHIDPHDGYDTLGDRFGLVLVLHALLGAGVVISDSFLLLNPVARQHFLDEQGLLRNMFSIGFARFSTLRRFSPCKELLTELHTINSAFARWCNEHDEDFKELQRQWMHFVEARFKTETREVLPVVGLARPFGDATVPRQQSDDDRIVPFKVSDKRQRLISAANRIGLNLTSLSESEYCQAESITKQFELGRSDPRSTPYQVAPLKQLLNPDDVVRMASYATSESPATPLFWIDGSLVAGNSSATLTKLISMGTKAYGDKLAVMSSVAEQLWFNSQAVRTERIGNAQRELQRFLNIDREVLTSEERPNSIPVEDSLVKRILLCSRQVHTRRVREQMNL